MVAVCCFPDVYTRVRVRARGIFQAALLRNFYIQHQKSNIRNFPAAGGREVISLS